MKVLWQACFTENGHLLPHNSSETPIKNEKMLNESPCSPVTCEGGLLWTVQSILTVILCSRLLWLNCWSILISGESAILAMTGGKASLPPSLLTEDTDSHAGHCRLPDPIGGRADVLPLRLPVHPGQVEGEAGGERETRLARPPAPAHPGVGLALGRTSQGVALTLPQGHLMSRHHILLHRNRNRNWPWCLYTVPWEPPEPPVCEWCWLVSPWRPLHRCTHWRPDNRKLATFQSDSPQPPEWEQRGRDWTLCRWRRVWSGRLSSPASSRLKWSVVVAAAGGDVGPADWPEMTLPSCFHMTTYWPRFSTLQARMAVPPTSRLITWLGVMISGRLSVSSLLFTMLRRAPPPPPSPPRWWRVRTEGRKNNFSLIVFIVFQ